MPNLVYRLRLIAAAAFTLVGAAAQGADFPASNNPVTIFLGFPAGGGMDAMARTLQEPMAQALKANVVIDYRPGAGGNIASQLVANAKPDGHTLLVGTAGTHGINAALYKRLPFDVEDDFTPIAKFLDAPNVLVINPSAIKVRNAREFISEVKAHPSKYSYASSGFGTSGHLATADIVARAGLDMTHIPFKGGAAAILSLLRGEVCCFLTQAQVILPHLKTGKVLAIGTTTAERIAILPDVPTIAEDALPGYENSLWFGLFGPKGMDPKTVAALSSAVKQALETPAVRKKLEELGNTVHYETPEQFRASVKADRVTWAEIVKTTGASID